MSKKRRRGRRGGRSKKPKVIQQKSKKVSAIKTLGAAAKGGWAATRGFLQPKQGKYDDSGKYSQSEY